MKVTLNLTADEAHALKHLLNVLDNALLLRDDEEVGRRAQQIADRHLGSIRRKLLDGDEPNVTLKEVVIGGQRYVNGEYAGTVPYGRSGSGKTSLPERPDPLTFEELDDITSGPQ